jgi:hypothetical protein
MKLYLTRTQALENYKITEKELDNLIETGQVNAILVETNGDRTLAIYDDDLAAYVAERDITPEKFDHLRNNFLGIGEAGLKYGVAPTVISGWIKQGKLEVKGSGERNKKLLDEAEVAFLVELGRAKKMRPGKKPFRYSD